MLQQPRRAGRPASPGRCALGSLKRPVMKPCSCDAAERPAAARAVAQPVAEGADAGAGHVALRGVHAAGAVGHLAEVPALAVDVDLRAVHAVLRQGERVQRLRAASACSASCGGPSGRSGSRPPCTASPRSTHRVDHQLLHHAVLGGGVLAAGAGLDVAVGVQAVVVAGHDPVEHRLVVLARRRWCGCRRRPSPRAGRGGSSALHHLAELDDARRALRVGGVAALGHGVVARVVAPVEAVLVRAPPSPPPAAARSPAGRPERSPGAPATATCPR